MIDRRIVFEIHRLKDIGLSIREIARHLKIDRESVSRYLKDPDPRPRIRPGRPSKLDPYREKIQEIVSAYPSIKAPVIMQHLIRMGFDGRITIVREYLCQLKGNLNRQAFCRFESAPGEQMQVDWGHFQSLVYGDAKRKLYALVVLEGHSRMLHVTFTHSQKQEALHQGLLNAFSYFGGTPNSLVVDNMMTAVTERVGSLIRFNEAFLDFLRPFKITPVPCNIGAPHEKGKVENSIKYIKNNFWPLRTFKDLTDVQSQVNLWIDTVANVRKHQTTGEKPKDRFQKEKLRPLPDHVPDCRETETVLVHKDFGIRFDANIYTVPPWAVGKKVTVKADHQRVFIYDKDRLLATHFRSWERKQRIELPAHREQLKKLRNRLYRDRLIMVFLSIGPAAADYLERLSDAHQPIKKTVVRLLKLRDRYGATPLTTALEKAIACKLYGADYIENILHQEMTPTPCLDPVCLKNPDLNRIILPTPCLEEYDTYAVLRQAQQPSNKRGET
jgi:transposase